jgi:thioredoxin-like negative regulator of GroEL
MYQTIGSINEFETAINEHVAALFYFSHNECNVCKVLKPKVEELFVSEFPQTALFYVNTKESPELAAQQSVFAVPSLLIFIDGREFVRKSRNIGLNELQELMERPYKMMFE